MRCSDDPSSTAARMSGLDSRLFWKSGDPEARFLKFPGRSTLSWLHRAGCWKVTARWKILVRAMKILSHGRASTASRSLCIAVSRSLCHAFSLFRSLACALSCVRAFSLMPFFSIVSLSLMAERQRAQRYHQSSHLTPREFPIWNVPLLLGPATPVKHPAVRQNKEPFP